MNSKEFADRIRGKLCLVFGSPAVGKTVLGLAVSRHFERPVVIRVDTNYPENYTQINPNAHFIDAHSFRKIYHVLNNLPENADFIMVDSITSIASEVVGENLLSPRRTLLLSNFYDWAFRKLATAKKHATILVIAHERLKNFETGEIGPRLNEIALRHVDLVYRMVVEGDERKLIKVFDRGGEKKLVLNWRVVE